MKTIVLSLVLSFGITAQGVMAQVIPDNTVGTTVSGSNLIEGGTRVGNNLFHSFSQFSIPTGGSAIFNNLVDIQNIFSRVTGTTQSSIDGLIKAQGNANLFLMNPNGILFGPNAKLDIGGSFVGTTATSIKFADGVQFSSSDLSSNPLLTVNLPIGLQFGQNLGIIELQSTTLETQPNQAIALIGGEIQTVASTLLSRGGPISLGSVQQPGTVSFNSDYQFDYQAIQKFGNINITNQSRILSGGQGAGSIQIQGGQVALTGLSYIWAVTEGDRDGKPMTINASEQLKVLDVTSDGSDFSWIMTSVAPNAIGQGSSLTLNSPRIIADGSYIASLTYGASQAGDLSIKTQVLQVSNSAQIATSTFSSGNAGNLLIQSSDSIEVTGFKPSLFQGSFYIFSSALFADADLGSTGNGGNVKIETNHLKVTDGGRIAASVQSTSSGNAGNLTIQAKDITVDGVIVNQVGSLSGILVDVQPGAQGMGGVLKLEADRLKLLNGGQVSASNFGTGEAGNIFINARSIDIMGSSSDGQIPSRISATSQTNFSAGAIMINAQDITLRDRGIISVSSLGSGNAGNLNIQANRLNLYNGSQLKSESQGGTEGNINLDITNSIVLRGGSSITTEASKLAAGGNIIIKTSTLVGLENSDIIANAIAGRGGNIAITTQGIIGLKYRDRLTLENDITASSEFGVNGTVQVNSLGLDPSSGLVKLDGDVIDSSRSISKGCAGTQGNSFISTGRGGIPQDPAKKRRIDRTWNDLRVMTNSTTVSPIAITIQPIVEASNIKVNSDGSIALINESPISVNSGETCAIGES